MRSRPNVGLFAVAVLMVAASLTLAHRMTRRPDIRGPWYAARVITVIDGDTVGVRGRKGNLRVRLYGIDCPEIVQAYGPAAKRFTEALSLGKNVKIRLYGWDRYGRRLGEIFLGNGESLNRELVRAGLAWWYRYYLPKKPRPKAPSSVAASPLSTVPTLEAEVLEAAEKEARKARRGLWADEDAVAPWDHRQAQRRSFWDDW